MPDLMMQLPTNEADRVDNLDILFTPKSDEVRFDEELLVTRCSTLKSLSSQHDYESTHSCSSEAVISGKKRLTHETD